MSLSGTVKRVAAKHRVRSKQVESGDVSLPDLIAATAERPTEWGADYLRTLLLNMLQALPRSSIIPLMTMLRRRPVVWASGCSGSDSPSWVFKALHEALRGGKFVHLFSAESDMKKRQWIAHFTDAEYIFGDVFDITRSRAHCY